MPLPLMPTSDSSVASAMPPAGAPQPPMLPPSGGDLASLMGGAPPSSAQGAQNPMVQAASSALQQMDQIAQMVQDLTRTFPGSEQFARQIVEGLDQWRQQILMATTPTSQQMPGAAQMM